jgi:integrase
MPVYPGRRPKTWRVTIFAQGKQHEWIVEGPRKDAKAHEARMQLALQARATAQTRSVPIFSVFCEETYRPHAETHLRASTWRKVRVYQVATLVEFLGDLRLDDFTPEKIEKFKRWRIEAGVQSSSINNELRVLKTMLRWGREQMGLPVPTLRLKMMPKEGKRRVRTWSLDEVHRLYEAAKPKAPQFVPLLHFLLDTGCRKGELLAAEWGWIDWEARLLRIPVTDEWRPKDKEAREVPLSDALLESLKVRERKGRYIFPNNRGERYQTFPEKLFRRLTKAAGVLGGPHTTRHTYASHFLKAQPDLPLLAQVLGHSQTYVTELYTHLLPEHLDRARNAVQLPPPPSLRLVPSGSARKLWRPTLAKASHTPKTPKKTYTRH